MHSRRMAGSSSTISTRAALPFGADGETLVSIFDPLSTSEGVLADQKR